MFFLDSNDPLMADAMSSILQQKEIIHTLDQKKNIFLKLKLLKILKTLNLEVFQKLLN